jgi:CHAD domain-containing protein
MRDGGPPEVADSRAYRLLGGEPIAHGIKRVVLARVDHALAELRGETESTAPEAVHEARKDLKKVRAAIRLVRDELGDEVYRRENGHYRDAGRLLSGSRDAEVLVESLDGLLQRYSDAAGERYAGLREQLGAALRARRGDGSEEAAMRSAILELESGRERVASWQFSGDGWKMLAPGLRRVYRRGRRRLRAAEEEPSGENLHEWRKQAKDLWYHLRLLRDANPALLQPLADHAHDLSDHLGDDHDLAVLREEAGRRRTAFADTGDERLFFELLDRRRGELQFAALSLGKRIYAEKPKRFTKAMRDRWLEWRKREPVGSTA